MAVLTMADAVLHGGYTDLEAGVIKLFDEINPIAEHAVWVGIDGNAYTYRRQESLPSVTWRGVNQTITPTYGTINPLTEKVMILDGEVRIDRALIKTQGRGEKAVDLKTSQYDMMVQAASNAISQAFFEGDDEVDVNTLVGLRQRLTGNQVLNAATNATALTLGLMDQLIDLVPFPADGNKVIYENRTLRRKHNTLILAAGGSINISLTRNSVGNMVDAYNDCPIKIVETTGDGSTILDFDETNGTSATAASIYVVAWGQNKVHMIYGGGDKMLEVQDMGEMQERRSIMGFLEMFPGMCIKHGRAAARLRGVTNA